jgi:hypothetical protein
MVHPEDNLIDKALTVCERIHGAERSEEQAHLLDRVGRERLERLCRRDGRSPSEGVPEGDSALGIVNVVREVMRDGILEGALDAIVVKELRLASASMIDCTLNPPCPPLPPRRLSSPGSVGKTNGAVKKPWRVGSRNLTPFRDDLLAPAISRALVVPPFTNRSSVPSEKCRNGTGSSLRRPGLSLAPALTWQATQEASRVLNSRRPVSASFARITSLVMSSSNRRPSHLWNVAMSRNSVDVGHRKSTPGVRFWDKGK